MADPARKIDPTDTGGDELNFDVTQTGPQLKSTKITGGDGQGGDNSTTIGPSIAANDNAGTTNNGSSVDEGRTSNAQPNAQDESPTSAPQVSPSASPPTINQSQAASQQESTAPVTAIDSNEPNGARESSSPNEKSKANAEKEEAATSGDKKEEKRNDKEKDSPETKKEDEREEPDAQAKKQESTAQAASQDSDPEKAVQNLTNRNSDTQLNKPAVQAGAQPQANNPLSAQPRPVGRRNPLRPNTTTRPSQAMSRPSSGQGTGSLASTAGNAAGATTGVAGQMAKKGADLVKKGASKVKEMGERQLADEKDGKVSQNDLTQGPNLKTKVGGITGGQILEGANAQKQVAEAAARRAGAIAGNFGANKKQQEFISINLIALINVIFLVIELLLIETVIAAFFLVFHIIIFLWWLLSKGRWKKAWLGTVALFLMPFVSIFALFAIAAMGILGTAFIVCNQTAQSIPFGIPISYVTSIGSFFGANVGPFAQVCDHLTVHSSGVGGGRNQVAQNSSGQTPTSTTQVIGSINGQVILVDENGQTLTPVIPNTQLVRPQPLAPEIITQANRAGYLSPASCKLGEIPYSEEMTTRSVRLDNGQTKLVAFPIHKTIDCIKNDATKTTLRSIQLGKVVRLVDDDSVLGKYVTIEYPNGLRVSYYHLDQLTSTLALGSVLNAGQPIGTMGKTGQISFEGTQMLFELKDASGNWKIFNPINSNAEASILTTFPCADNANSQCLLD